MDDRSGSNKLNEHIDIDIVTLTPTYFLKLRITERAFPHLQVDHYKVVCKLRDFLGLCKFGLECLNKNKISQFK